jgi:lysozyme
MKPSQKCFDLAASFEGCGLLAYDDARPDYTLRPGDEIEGTLTIGRGHTGPDVHIDLVWTQEQADAQFAQDLQVHCNQAVALVKVPLSQGQVDALTSFVYNEGSGTLEKSTLLKILNQGNYAGVPDQLCTQDDEGNWHGYVFFQGKVSPGLVRRRQAEIALWNS